MVLEAGGTLRYRPVVAIVGFIDGLELNSPHSSHQVFVHTEVICIHRPARGVGYVSSNFPGKKTSWILLT